MKFKYGKGLGNEYTSSFGGLTLELQEKWKNKTLKEIAEILKNYTKIKDGEIELFNIGWNFRKKENGN